MSVDKKEEPENPPAFPPSSEWLREREKGYWPESGMTLRDYSAIKNAAAMVSTIRSEEDYERAKGIAIAHGFETISEWIAFDSYKQADALLKERSK